MSEILYQLFIFPVESLIGLIYSLLTGLIDFHGTAIIGLSIAVNFISLPLYMTAEKWQKAERDLQIRMRPKLNDIRAVFKGDEQHLIMNTYYRQNHYHPAMALRSILGLLIQIPFFIAAYHFLGHLELLKGQPFFFIRDLSAPDGLFQIGSFSVNILPVLMTVINLASALVYTKNLTLREQIQLYGMALIFLILLYFSSSALVLYWTVNNLFSLIKNLVYRSGNPRRLILILLSGLAGLYLIFLVLIRFPLFREISGMTDLTIGNKRWIFLAGLGGLGILILILHPLLFRFFRMLDRIIRMGWGNLLENTRLRNRVFILSSLSLVMITGLLIPGLLIRSSPDQFAVSPDGLDHPGGFIWITFLQAFSFFLVIPFVIYRLFNRDIQFYLSLFLFSALLTALVNLFLFPGSYGTMTVKFQFEGGSLNPGPVSVLLNALGVAGALAVSLTVIRWKKLQPLIIPVLIILILTGAAIFVLSASSIHKSYQELIRLKQSSVKPDTGKTEPVFNFSSNGKNVIVIMLDRAVGGLAGEIFEFDPRIKEGMNGFVWYRNTVSFNGHTVMGIPPLMGGYEYTPLEMNRKKDIPLVDKHNEALLVMPRLFSENGYQVTVTNPSLANYKWTSDLSIFKEFNNIRAENLIGRYALRWLKEHQLSIRTIHRQVMKEYLIRFSLFRISPDLIRPLIYDQGRWHDVKQLSSNSIYGLVSSYSVLTYLRELTGFTQRGNTFTLMVNESVHEPEMMSPPDYIPGETRHKSFESSYRLPFNDEETLKTFYTQAGSLKRLTEWFELLKAEGVYDRSKIIVVSDHGYSVSNPLLKSISPVWSEQTEYSYYNPLLLVKDFDSTGDLVISDQFMTNADTPFLAASHLPDPRNPYTGLHFSENPKKSGVDLVRVHHWNIRDHGKYQFNFTDRDIIRVKDDMTKKENWKEVKDE